jgi:tRNA(fMet)-specific endonuclease VapC
MSYLLDTNICIYIIKRKPEQVIARLNQIPFNQLYVSAITIAELEYGVRKSSLPDRNRLALNEFLIPFSIVDFDRAATIEYGIVRSELEKNGMPIGPLDMMIAAHAKSLSYVLVTNNEREFGKVNGLQVDNWTK